MNAPDWTSLAHNCGALDLACLTPDNLTANALAETLRLWQSRGNAGALDYVDQRADILAEPFASRPWARSLLILTFAPAIDPDSPVRRLPAAAPGRPAALIAPYALNQDYHLTGQAILSRLQNSLASLAPANHDLQFDACVDSKPVMEKPLALLAGLGSRGLNSLIRNASHGCQIHLALLFTSLTLPPHLLPPPSLIPCDDCRRCLRACPNHVFANGSFTVRHCRAWLASEYRRPLTAEQQRLLGNTLFGCGLCTTSCPSQSPPATPFAVDAQELLEMPAASLRSLIADSILERTGATLLKRNAAAALANQWSPGQWHDFLPRALASSNSPTVQQTIRNAFPTDE